MVLNVHRNYEAYQGRGKREKGVWRWEKREREEDYIPNRYTVTTRMTPALRWTAMRAVLMFH